MKRFLISSAILLSAMSAAAQTTPQPAPADAAAWSSTVTVTGTGRSSVTPDRVTFNVGVQTVAKTVDEAVNENNQRTAAVIAALKKAGATDRDIRTSNFSIFPQQDYSQGKLPQILGYQVSNNITVSRSAVADAGKLLQVALNAGVNQSSGLQFEVSNPAAGRDAGLRAAFEDARSKAALLAQTAGRRLGMALQISEGVQNTPRPPYPMPMAMKAEAGVASDVPVESGSEERTYSVTVVFALN